MAVVAIAFSSCKKDDNEAPVANTTKDPIAEKLLDFKQTIQSQNKEAVLFTMEDAEWHLEGLLNYEEANNEHNWHGLGFENRTYEVPVSNGQISSSDLNLAYESFLAEINSLLAEDENLHGNLVNIEIEENQMKDGTATVGMTYSFGSSINIYNYIQFGPTEYWSSEFNGGECGSNPINSPYGAPEWLEYKFNRPLSTGQPGYFTGPETVHIMGDMSPISTQNPAYPDREHIIYHYLGHPVCLSPEELNFYLNKFDYIKQLYAPTSKNFISVHIMPETLSSTVGYVYWMDYGTFHPNGGGIGSN